MIAATRPLRCNTGASRGFRTFALFVDLLKAAQKVGFHFVKALLCDVTACNGFPPVFHETRPSNGAVQASKGMVRLLSWI